MTSRVMKMSPKRPTPFDTLLELLEAQFTQSIQTNCTHSASDSHGPASKDGSIHQPDPRSTRRMHTVEFIATMRRLDPHWSGEIAKLPDPLHVALPGGRDPVDFVLEHRNSLRVVDGSVVRITIRKLQKHFFHHLKRARKGTVYLICKSLRNRKPIAKLTSYP